MSLKDVSLQSFAKYIRNFIRFHRKYWFEVNFNVASWLFSTRELKNSILAGALGTRLQFESFISFHLNSLISKDPFHKSQVLKSAIVGGNYSATFHCILFQYFACGYSFFLTCAIFAIFFANDCSYRPKMNH